MMSQHYENSSMRWAFWQMMISVFKALKYNCTTPYTSIAWKYTRNCTKRFFIYKKVRYGKVKYCLFFFKQSKFLINPHNTLCRSFNCLCQESLSPYAYFKWLGRLAVLARLHLCIPWPSNLVIIECAIFRYRSFHSCPVLFIMACVTWLFLVLSWLNYMISKNVLRYFPNFVSSSRIISDFF